MIDLLTGWWERDNQQKRQASLKPYPYPHDGASHVIMNNFFAVVGLADDRPYSDHRLNVLMYTARFDITEKFLKLWPKRVTTINEPTA
jgi:hypothetical protein